MEDVRDVPFRFKVSPDSLMAVVLLLDHPFRSFDHFGYSIRQIA